MTVHVPLEHQPANMKYCAHNMPVKMPICLLKLGFKEYGFAYLQSKHVILSNHSYNYIIMFGGDPTLVRLPY